MFSYGSVAVLKEKDNRDAATEWMLANIPKGLSIGMLDEFLPRGRGWEPHVGARSLSLSAWLADPAGVCLLVAWYVAWLAGVLGMLR